MINENELRIGNWFLDSQGKPEQVHSISHSFVNGDIQWHREEVDGDSPDEINPIPLTKEILGKCGFASIIDDENENAFEKTSGRVRFRLNHYQYTDGTSWFMTFVEHNVAMGFNHIVQSPPEHLHQLQNLYYVLAGEDLEVNL